MLEVLEKYDKNKDHNIDWKEYRHLVKEKLEGVRLTRRQWQHINVKFRNFAGVNLKMSPKEIDRMLDNE